MSHVNVHGSGGGGGRGAESPPPLRIDTHTHILPESLPDMRERYGYAGWVRLSNFSSCGKRASMIRDDGTSFREVENSLWSIPRRLGDCASVGVDVHVLSTVPVMFNYWARGEDASDLARLLNDHVAASVAVAPEHFAGLGTLPLQHPELAVGELRRCKALGLAGVQIGTNVSHQVRGWGGKDTEWRHWPLSAPELFPVFKAAAELDMCVFVHPWDMMGSEYMRDYFLPWLVGMPAETTQAMCAMMFSGILERLPNLRVCFAHGGGAFSSTLGRIQHGWAVRQDLCARDTSWSPQEHVDRKRFWVDSLVHEPHALNQVVRVYGADRVCEFGGRMGRVLGLGVFARASSSRTRTPTHTLSHRTHTLHTHTNTHCTHMHTHTHAHSSPGLGSDYPFPLGEYTAESQGKEYCAGALVDQMAKDAWPGWELGGGVRKSVLGGAALQWLARDESSFRRMRG
jgi:aminocarboxymuconate-semialdehyde decarboxylase